MQPRGTRRGVRGPIERPPRPSTAHVPVAWAEKGILTSGCPSFFCEACGALRTLAVRRRSRGAHDSPTILLAARLRSLPPPLQAAQSPTRPIELADYYRVEAINGTALSPDGRTVAFVRTFIVEAENRRHSEIWTVPADGSAPPRRLTNPALRPPRRRAGAPTAGCWPSRSRRAAVEPGGPVTDAVWFLRMDAPGGEAFRIPGVDGTPIFSPDNRWIAFTKAGAAGDAALRAGPRRRSRRPPTSASRAASTTG